MPLPIRRDYIRNRQSSGGAGSFTIQVPRPGGAVEGDWIIVLITVGSSSAPVTSSPGWQQILYQNVNTRMMGIFARKYDEDDDATYPITVTTGAATGFEVSSMAIGDAADSSSWVFGPSWRRQDNGGSQAITQSPGITVPDDTLVLSLQIEATNAVENDGDEIISGATKWYGSPNQTTPGVSIERVVASYIEVETATTTGAVTTTWPNAALNGAGIQIGIPYLESAPPAHEHILDTFERTVSNGWGAADVGGPYSHGTGTSMMSVHDGRAHIVFSSGSGSMYGRLTSQVLNDIEMYVEWSSDTIPVGSNIRPRFVTRYISGVGDYHVRASITPGAAADFRWYRDDTAGLGSTVTLPRTYIPGDILKVRLQTFPDGAGVTRLRARMWYGDESEPTTWTIDITDATPAYQASGIVSLFAGVNGLTNGPATVSFDNLIVTPRGRPMQQLVRVI